MRAESTIHRPMSAVGGHIIDPFDQEPAPRPEEQAQTPIRIAATAAAALPGVGFGVLCILKGIGELRAASPTCTFHLTLGLALLVLFADVAVVIHRSNDIAVILSAGVLGFVGAFAAVTLAELGGPVVLAGLAIVAGVGALVVIRAPRRSAGRVL